MIAQSIVTTNGSSPQVNGDVLVRSENAARLKPFSAEAQVAVFRLNVQMGAETEWKFLLAVGNDRLDGLLPGEAGGAMPMARPHLPSDGTSGAFAELPMPVEAVLSEFEVTLGRLDSLAPGDEIPLAIAGELPLRMGEKVLAHGALGTLENRMALRVTRLAHSPRPGTASPSPEFAA
jgi:flagellar motor switch/type III secretory pathway protein FliN